MKNCKICKYKFVCAKMYHGPFCTQSNRIYTSSTTIDIEPYSMPDRISYKEFEGMKSRFDF